MTLASFFERLRSMGSIKQQLSSELGVELDGVEAHVGTPEAQVGLAVLGAEARESCVAISPGPISRTRATCLPIASIIRRSRSPATA